MFCFGEAARSSSILIQLVEFRVVTSDPLASSVERRIISRFRSRSITVGGHVANEDVMLFEALYMKTALGPQDRLLNKQGGGSFRVSTCKFPFGVWQTAIFERARVFSRFRPVLRVNEMSQPFEAFINHLTALVLVAEATRSSWPVGIKWEAPPEQSWSTARQKVDAEIQDYTNRGPDYYSELRARYACGR